MPKYSSRNYLPLRGINMGFVEKFTYCGNQPDQLIVQRSWPEKDTTINSKRSVLSSFLLWVHTVPISWVQTLYCITRLHDKFFINIVQVFVNTPNRKKQQYFNKEKKNGLQIGVTGEPHKPMDIYQFEKYFNMLATGNATYERNYANRFSMRCYKVITDICLNDKADMRSFIFVSQTTRLFEQTHQHPIKIF